MEDVGFKLCSAITQIAGGCILDSDNILWKHIGEDIVGRRSVWTNKNRSIWLSDLQEGEEVKDWWSGVGADYNEQFKQKSNGQ